MAEEVNQNSYTKLAQLCAALEKDFEPAFLKEILRQDGDINCRFPSNDYFKNHNPSMIGCSILHFIMNNDQILSADILEMLMGVGVDFTIENDQGCTALHQACVDDLQRLQNTCNKGLENSRKRNFMNRYLEMQVKSDKVANPSDNNGITHLHIACALDNVEAVNFFLENDHSVDQAIHMDSPIFPGYTPLHFAARFDAFRAVRSLLKYHPRLDSKDARGMTPMHVLIERNIEAINIKYYGYHRRVDGQMKSFDHANPRETIMTLLLQYKQNRFGNDNGSLGLSDLHVACALKDRSVLQDEWKKFQHMDLCVPHDSPHVWPGYTPLHFAVLCNIQTAEFLVRNGADIEAKDVNGVTPFDLCLQVGDVEAVHSILSLSKSNLKDVLFSDGTTKLLTLLGNMVTENSTLAGGDINVHLPRDSPLWPGYTPLHIAVLFAEPSDGWKSLGLISRCLAARASVFAQDSEGSTPLHVAFRLENKGAMDIICNAMVETPGVMWNLYDHNNWSLLHIAIAAGNLELIRKILDSGADVNMKVQAPFKLLHAEKFISNKEADSVNCDIVIPIGSTPLHIAASLQKYDVMGLLLEYGANVYAKDVQGTTPIHRQISLSDKTFDYFLLLPLDDPRECVVKYCGLSHLHVASRFKDAEAINRLLCLGADVNATIKYDEEQTDESMKFLAPFANFTPLHFAVLSKVENDAVTEILLKRGADVFAKSSDGVPLLYKNPSCFFSFLEANEDLRQRMTEETGLTLLHLACGKVSAEEVQRGRKSVVDFNARTRDDSPLWPGRTALDVFIEHSTVYAKNKEVYCGEDAEINRVYHLKYGNQTRLSGSRLKKSHIALIVEFALLIGGADVTLINGSKTTPLLEADRLDRAYRTIIGKDILKKTRVKCTWNTTTLEKDEEVSSSDRVHIMSHYQKDFTVNPTNAKGISHFHVACLRGYFSVVGKFLECNVDVNAKISDFSDEFPGFTPLHLIAFSSCNLEIIKLLLNHGADVNARDVYGNTPLHIAAKKAVTNCREIFQIMIQHGADFKAMNTCGETPLNVLWYSQSKKPRSEDTNFILATYGYRTNSFNRLNRNGWMPMILFKASGPVSQSTFLNAPDKNRLDKTGRTMIHNLAACSKNVDYGNIFGLFIFLGNNVDHQDNDGSTALHVASQFENHKAVRCLLELGADINIQDKEGKLPSAYCHRPNVLKEYHLRRQIMSICNLELSKENKEFLISSGGVDDRFERLIKRQLRRLELIQIKSSTMKLSDVLSERTNFVHSYAELPELQRSAIDFFFKSNLLKTESREFDRLLGVLRLQYNKAVERLRLVDYGFSCLRDLLRFPVPILCNELITKHLSNLDLRHLIAAIDEQWIFKVNDRIQFGSSAY